METYSTNNGGRDVEMERRTAVRGCARVVIQPTAESMTDDVSVAWSCDVTVPPRPSCPSIQRSVKRQALCGVNFGQKRTIQEIGNAATHLFELS